MIARSHAVGVLALAGAAAIHVALALALMSGEDVQIQSGAGAQEAGIGTSFADMAAGTLDAVQATETMAAAPAEPIEASTATPIDAEPLKALDPADTVSAMTAQAPDEFAIRTPQMAQPVTPDPAQDALQPEAAQAVSQSLRPKRRSAAFEQKNKQAAAPKPKPQTANQTATKPVQQPRGNADQNAAAGTLAGSAAAKAATSGTAQSAAAASGNAAASNYPGRVMQHLSRMPRPRAGSRGTAVVAFSVSGGGGLGGVSIARSSGSATLDSAAIRMIQGAAPFPAPPPGAQRSFSISIKGR